MIRLVVTVPLELPEQVGLERAAHSALDPHGRTDWDVTVSPFLTMPGCLLEVAADGHTERRLLDTLGTREVEASLRQIAQRSELRTKEDTLHGVPR